LPPWITKLLAEESYPNNIATVYPLIGKGGKLEGEATKNKEFRQEGKMPVFIDTIPNWLKHPTIGKQEKTRVSEEMLKGFQKKVPDAVTRLASLPALMVQPGEYCSLLMEARELFVLGYFYSCVAMCGITAERIVKDIFSKSLLVITDSHAAPPTDEAIKDLESFGAKDICEFLIDALVLDRNLKPAFQALGKLRNKYAHAGGKEPKRDARAAIKHLHKIIEGTVSILKDWDIKEGKLVRKLKKKASNRK